MKSALIDKNHVVSCRKERRILHCHIQNKVLLSEYFAHHLLLLFYPIKDKKEWLSSFPPLNRNRMQEKEVLDIANIKK